MGIAVASGAVLRALNKDHGPGRVMTSSFGIVQKVPYEPDERQEHKHLPLTSIKPDKYDGEWYVEGSVVWIFQKVCHLPPRLKSQKRLTPPQGNVLPDGEEKIFESTHTFSMDRDEVFRCEEYLYESDVCTESYYPRTHEKNRGMVFHVRFSRLEELIRSRQNGRKRPFHH
jgi:hypothetical protein